MYCLCYFGRCRPHFLLGALPAGLLVFEIHVKRVVMNPGNENKLSISVSLQKQRSMTQGIKSDSTHRTGSLLLSKTHSKPRQSRSQRKENLSRNLSVEKPVPPEAVEGSGKRLFVVRHGERVDFTFGATWIQRCFDVQG